MRIFLINIIFIVSLTFVFALVTDFFVKEYFFKFHRRSKTELYEMNADIVFFGSSRCANGVVPSVVDSVLGSNSFNMAWAASNPREIYAALLLYLRNNSKPSIIVIQVDLEHINLEEDRLAKVPLLKYCGRGIIDDYYSENTNIENKIPLLFSIKYRDFGWRELLKASLRNKIEVNNKGFAPIGGYLSDTSNFPCDSVSRKIFSDKNDWLLKIVEKCSSERINLIFFTSPYLKLCDAQNFELLKMYGVPYYNYSTSLSDSGLFKDNSHVNEKGAYLFSMLLARDLCAYK
jgi:hypothetical protein